MLNVEERTTQDLLEGVLQVQTRRAALYQHFDQGFKDVLRNGNEATFQSLALNITQQFNECSRMVIEAETRLGEELGRSDLALSLRQLQEEERAKLQMTVTLQALRKAESEKRWSWQQPSSGAPSRGGDLDPPGSVIRGPPPAAQAPAARPQQPAPPTPTPAPSAAAPDAALQNGTANGTANGTGPKGISLEDGMSMLWTHHRGCACCEGRGGGGAAAAAPAAPGDAGVHAASLEGSVECGTAPPPEPTEDEFRNAVGEAAGLLQATVTRIIDLVEELRYELAELRWDEEDED